MSVKNGIEKIIEERIESGKMTFAEFMETCLYEPGLGYYTSPGRKVGGEGDFYTSISVHAAFGRVIAREIAQMWRCLSSPGEFTLVECGAGNGRLACDIMDYLSERERGVYEATRLLLVEREPTLKDAQREQLCQHLSRIGWLSPGEFLSSGKITNGCVYSNELLDSFPVHRVLMTAEGVKEIYVTMKEGELTDEAGEISTTAIEEYLERAGVRLLAGQEAEINLRALEWLESVATAIERGFILTVDYGFTATELFAPHRKRGTLLCYHRHQVEENPYIRPGKQDITSHVDFTSLMKRGEEIGLRSEWFGEQYRFLLSCGLVEELEEIERSEIDDQEKLRLRLALKKLIMPEGGMGDTFKVLIQSKGVDGAKLLSHGGIAGLPA